jgi:hypothetical protein
VDSLAGKKVRCAQLGSFIIVEAFQWTLYLDTKRVFSRWSVAGRVLLGNRLDAIRVLWESSKFMAPYSLWKEYGRVPYSPQELEILSAKELHRAQWRDITILSQEEINDRLALGLDKETDQLIANLLREKIQLYLHLNNPEGYQLMSIQYPKVNKLNSMCVLGVKFKLGNQIRTLELRIPVNTVSSPFVGYAEDINLGPIPDQFMQSDPGIKPSCQ